MANGANEAALLAAAGLGAVDLGGLNARISPAQMAALWAAAVEATGDPDFGLHLGHAPAQGAVSIVGYVMLSARTLGDALQALARYHPLLALGRTAVLDPGAAGQPAAFQVTASQSEVRMRMDRQPHEAGLAWLASFTMTLTGRPLPIIGVTFAHPRPPHGTATHEAVFGVVPTFGAPANRIEFEADALGWPGRAASDDLHAAFAREADLALARLATDVRSRVASAVETRFQDAVPTLAEVAADLGLGERTLQRALSDEGTSFQKVVDEVRCDLAVRHLGEDALTIHEVGFRLGYSSPSAFHRAFKRWMGLTPSAYRARTHVA